METSVQRWQIWEQRSWFSAKQLTDLIFQNMLARGYLHQLVQPKELWGPQYRVYLHAEPPLPCLQLVMPHHRWPGQVQEKQPKSEGSMLSQRIRKPKARKSIQRTKSEIQRIKQSTGSGDKLGQVSRKSNKNWIEYIKSQAKLKGSGQAGSGIQRVWQEASSSTSQGCSGLCTGLNLAAQILILPGQRFIW